MRFAEQRKAIVAADVAVGFYRDPASGKDEIVIVKGRRIVEDVATSGAARKLEPCFVHCGSREEALRLLSIFKDW